MSEISNHVTGFDTATAPERVVFDNFFPETPIPVQFSGCVGFLHPAIGSTGVVILAPFGYEAMAAHKSLRGLAVNLAAAGMPVLRFDYPGTGDAVGNETNRELIASRCKAAADACRFLREQGNVENIVLVGLRLGASVAAMVASSCNVKELVLIEPVVSGRVWLQQLDNLHTMAGVSKPQSRRKLPGGVREFLGFGMSAASLQAVEALDLHDAHLPAKCRVLVLSSDASPSAGSLIAGWKNAGADVDARPYKDFPQMMLDPAVARAPVGGLVCVEKWLKKTDAAARSVSFNAEAFSIVGRQYKERPVFFGGDHPRFGVLCEPAGLRKAGPAIILPNVGGAPHTGWGRQNVELARHLAGEGFVSFRIDGSGLGETPPIPGRPRQVVYVPEACDNVIAAVDWLEGAGFRKPALAGICNGAYLAFQAVQADDRISGILLVNLRKFIWCEKDSIELYRSRGVRAPGEKNKNGIWSAFAGFQSLFKSADRETSAVKTPGDVQHVLRSALERGVRVSLVYSDGDPGVADMNAQLGHRGRELRDCENFDVRIAAPTRHIFDTAVDRSKLMPIVTTFAKSLEVARLRGLTRDQSNEPAILPGIGMSGEKLKKWDL